MTLDTDVGDAWVAPALAMKLVIMAEDELLPCPTARQLLLEGVSKLYDDEASADVLIIGEERKWKVHKLLLSVHSTVLASACVKDPKELAYEMIDLSDEAPDNVDALLFYLYHLNYDERLFTTPAFRLMFHVEMCIMANKFNIRPLHDLAVDKFKTHVQCTDVSEQELAQAAMIAYEAPPDSTAEVCQQIAKTAIRQKLYVYGTTPGSVSQFETLMRTCSALAADIAIEQQAMLEAMKSVQFKCPDKRCGTTFLKRIFVDNGYGLFACPRCEQTFKGSQWMKNIIEG